MNGIKRLSISRLSARSVVSQFADINLPVAILVTKTAAAITSARAFLAFGAFGAFGHLLTLAFFGRGPKEVPVSFDSLCHLGLSHSDPRAILAAV